jgi:hypothetical protein
MDLSRGLGDVYKRQTINSATELARCIAIVMSRYA